MSTESAVVAAATAAVFSPRTRETMRKGAVIGVAGALKVGDVVTGAARGVVRGVKGEEEMPAPAGNGADVAPPKASRKPAAPRARRSPAAGGSTSAP